MKAHRAAGLLVLSVLSLAVLSCRDTQTVYDPPGNAVRPRPTGMTVSRNTSFVKIHRGDIIVTNGAAFRLLGMVEGDVYVYSNSSVLVDGTLHGDIYQMGGEVVIRGRLAGRVWTEGE